MSKVKCLVVMISIDWQHERPQRNCHSSRRTVSDMIEVERAMSLPKKAARREGRRAADGGCDRHQWHGGAAAGVTTAREEPGRDINQVYIGCIVFSMGFPAFKKTLTEVPKL